MSLDRNKISFYCDRVLEYSLYLTAYFLPISKAIIESTAGVAIAALVVKKLVEKKLPHTALNLPLAVFALMGGISVIGSDNFNTSLHNYIGKLIQGVLFFFAVFEGINTRKKVRNLLFIMLASAFLVSIDGITQFFTHKDFIRGRNMPFRQRINAPFYTPNDLGAFLVPVLLVALSLLFTRFRNIAARFAIRLAPLALFAALVLTFSRGAWLSFMMGLIFMLTISLLLKRRDVIPLALLLILILIMSVPLRNDIPLANIFDLTDTGSVDRKGLWTIALNMIKARPVFGHGIGTFMHNFKKYDTVGYTHSVSYAHNCYLQMAAELGLAGIVSFLWMLLVLFLRCLRNIFADSKNIDFIFLGIISGLAAYLIHSSVETNFYSVDLGMLFWLLVGLVASVEAQRRASS